MLPRLAAAEVKQRTQAELTIWQLYNQCKPINFGVEDLSEDAKKLGLKRESIMNLAESKLRGARMYNKDSHSFLYIDVDTWKNAYYVSLKYHKQVLSFNEWGSAST